MKIKTAAVIGLAFVSLGGTVHASLPVIDFANLAQALLQVDAWKQQYEQMADQHGELRRQVNAITGTRNLGNVASNPALKDIVPADVAEIYSAIQSGGASALTPAAQTLRERTRLYDCEDRHDDDLINCQALLSNNAQQQALGQTALSLVNQRTGQIQTLQNQISATNDAKAIGELQARLQVEATQVGNDANRLMLMKMLAEAADRGAQQAMKERELKTLSLASDGSDTFVYVPFARRQ